MSPHRAQSRPGAKCESRLSSEESSPTTAPGIMKPVYELRDGGEPESVHDNDAAPRTPNVYINGLPPHFADESLYLMTRDFGNVLSVRTFTRCVGEKMSGYGFVLHGSSVNDSCCKSFDSVESAERCIETLRKYRNLHPSFSKVMPLPRTSTNGKPDRLYSQQIHKIPGTPYASGTITIPPTGPLSSLASQHSMSTLSSFPSMTSTLVSSTTSSSLPSAASPSKANDHHTGESVSTTTSSDFSGKEMKELSFREKMERLKDERSTNLYMEGLPLSIDDVSLSALISPHKIISSRFFQTKLSNPPRMIAFVRLDTRVGAEEIIDRLHGRVVRGWNDNGCRISVRFADTNEQRELRRSERLNRGEEELSNGHQLSMAHAALLNLRGAEAQAQLGNATLRQHMHVANLDHRPPVTLSSVQSADTTSTESNGANTDSFQRLNILHHSSHALGNIQPDIVRTAQYYHRTPALSHQSQAVPLDNATSAMTLLNGSTGLFDANQFALLQQQTQLQQLQLLKQMQSMGFDPTFAIDDRSLNRSRPLMPSADITTNEVDGTRAQAATSQLTSCQTAHRRNDSNPHTQQHTGSYSKGGIPNFPSPVLQHATRNGRYMEHGSNNDQLAGKQHQYPLNHSPLSEGLVSNFDHHRGPAVEESEVTLISPALTYASRTPSTLSPATPLFNAFGTPASVPATVPRGKANPLRKDGGPLYAYVQGHRGALMGVPLCALHGRFARTLGLYQIDDLWIGFARRQIRTTISNETGDQTCSSDQRRRASMTLDPVLYYDYLLTFGEEVRFFWRRRANSVTVLFFLNRYLSIFGNIPVILQSFRSWSHTPAEVSPIFLDHCSSHCWDHSHPPYICALRTKPRHRSYHGNLRTHSNLHRYLGYCGKGTSNQRTL
ncbi:uncharacterized protein FOMMEDRAFT_145007 [Fomitiporia mediterranea MF3/22]|uniref:uncharacterized protein n=1 Tax=Fomitiporia mediterranea (strain MF3/22) TaxID=694068 RepID=UPI00044078D1|nr:uncharacterized protein FOMMEDRAFT_145007 [Fomitiporia mediterranea MF3/22]EJD05471.1 hypothetical protein FOMMEDRAFT_145007 [Fomitiporia mediterranea MF3/22]